jgi:pSer/pThr/pTyr-binding forkhead associated (FHA) protein
MPNYPALLDLDIQALHPLGVSESFLVGRNETADVCVLDRTCSRHHFRIARRDGRYFVEPLSAQNPTYQDNEPVRHNQQLEHGAIIQAGQTRFQFLMHAPGDATSQKALQPPISDTVPSATVIGTLAPGAEAVLEGAVFTLTGAMLIGREQGRVQIHLPHPQVSRIHASIALKGKTGLVTDLNSANGTFINGVRLRGAAALQVGDQLDVGPYALQFTGTALIPRPRTDNVELVARGIKRVVRSRETGKPLPLLEDITLVIRPREFVCLLGPSGSGKSTLLSALSGRSAPTPARFCSTPAICTPISRP